jgi:AraC-like DNA-binding protein
VIDAGTRVGLLKACKSLFTWKWHHDRYCFGIVHAGGYEIAGRGRSRSLMPGEVILAEPDDVYACRKALKPVCCDVVFLDTEFVRSCVEDGRRRVGPPHIGTPISGDPTLTAALRRFLMSASDMIPSLATDEALVTTVDVFLAACGQTGRPAGGEPRAVRQARSILHERLSEVVRLDDLATAVGLNRSYLVRTFKKAIGVPPHAYQRLVRISRARRLLAAGRAAAEIAQQLGSPTRVMYYAPNVTDAQVGGMPCPPCVPYPFVFESGPHGYIIQRLGDSESAKIVADEAELIKELCSYRSVLCLAAHDLGHSDSK